MSPPTEDVFYDLWDEPVMINSKYIQYRNRVFPLDVINVLNVKGKRLLINHYKQNTVVPTLLVIFGTPLEAEEALNTLRDKLYGKKEEEKKEEEEEEEEEKDNCQCSIFKFSLFRQRKN